MARLKYMTPPKTVNRFVNPLAEAQGSDHRSDRDLVSVRSSGVYSRQQMRDFDRTTRGGVGAVLLGLALAAVAMGAGWAAGSAANGRVASGACDAACASSAAAASDRAPALATSTIPTPVPTEPVGFPFVSARS